MSNTRDLNRYRKIYSSYRQLPRYDMTFAGDPSLDWKHSVHYLSDDATPFYGGTLSIPPAYGGGASGHLVIDGYHLNTPNVVVRVLFVNLSNAAYNGIYEYQYSAELDQYWLQRPIDASNGTLSSGATCYIEEGDYHAKQYWTLITPDPIEVGVTSLEWIDITDLLVAKFWFSEVNNVVYTTGSVEVRGGSLLTNQTTFNVVNTTAQTINFGGAATNIAIGSASGLTFSAGGNFLLKTASPTSTIKIGETSQTGKITVGQSTDTNTVAIGDGVIAAGKTGTVQIGTNSTSTGKTVVSIGSTNAGSRVIIRGGTSSDNGDVVLGDTYQTGLISVGIANVTSRVDIGNANITTGNTQTIFIGAGTHAGTGKSETTIGSTSNASKLTLQGGTGNITLDAGSSTGIVSVASNTTFDKNVTVTGIVSVASNATFDKNVTVTGDLTVNGTMATVNTTNLEIKDAVIGVGFQSGTIQITPVGDRGWIGAGSSTTNYASFYDSSAGEFAFATTTNSATGSLPIPITNYSNLRIANLQASIVTASLGFSGSHTKLMDGTSAFVAGGGIVISSGSNGSVNISSQLNTSGSWWSGGTVGSNHQVLTADGSGGIVSQINMNFDGTFLKVVGSVITTGSLAQGYRPLADGNFSHAEGGHTRTSNDYTHAEGSGSLASGEASHAEGYFTTSSYYYAHAEGFRTLADGYASHTEGLFTTASRNAGYAHAEGSNTLAYGLSSHAEGYFTVASGNYSHAEGSNSIASGTYSHAEGIATFATGSGAHSEGYNTYAEGPGSHAEGAFTTGSGDYSHSEGTKTWASGGFSHAEGQSTFARGTYSHTEGYFTLTATGANHSHAEGLLTTASINGAHAEGEKAQAEGYASHAEGYLAQTTGSARWGHAEGYTTISVGNASHAEGYSTESSGTYSHAEGYDSITSGSAAHAEGYYTRAEGNYSHTEGWGTRTLTTAVGAHAEGYLSTGSADYAHAEGYGTLAAANSAHSEGSSTYAVGLAAHAEGVWTRAEGNYSHSEGNRTKTLAIGAHSEGYLTTGSGRYSHAEGMGTEASGHGSHAEGSGSNATGDFSHASGWYNLASGFGSSARGYFTTASAEYSFTHGYLSEAKGLHSFAAGVWTEASGTELIPQVAFGKYNIRSNEKSLFVVGDGTSDTSRHDVFRINSGSISSLGGMVEVTGSLAATQGLTGSLTQLPDGTPYLLAGPNITLSTGSNGAVTIVASAGGAGSAGGVNGQVQFNNLTVLDGNAALTFAVGTGILTTQTVLPRVDNTYNLGSATQRWANVYTGDLHLKNDRGDWTLIEEEDFLTVRNNATGKRYKISMTPMDE